MDDFIDALVDELQRTNYNVLLNNCFHKSFEFRKRCRRAGVPARVLIGMGVQYTSKLHVYYPFFHARGFVDGKEYEVTHTRDYVSPIGTNAHDFVNLAGIWI